MYVVFLQMATFEEKLAGVGVTAKWLLTESKRLIRAELKAQGLAAEPQVGLSEAQVSSFRLACS